MNINDYNRLVADALAQSHFTTKKTGLGYGETEADLFNERVAPSKHSSYRKNKRKARK